MVTANIINQASKVRLLVLDVDGVLTDGKIYFDNNGYEMKSFHVRDGYGMVKLLSQGVKIAIISGRNAAVVDRRMRELGVDDVYQGVADKVAVLQNIVIKYGLDMKQVAYVGDDIPDMKVMQSVGIKVAVADAVEMIKQQADLVLQTSGGCGAVREFIDIILQAQGLVVA